MVAGDASDAAVTTAKESATTASARNVIEIIIDLRHDFYNPAKVGCRALRVLLP
jgi:hypothetical protein